jgi:hypothetical protein
MKEKEYIVEMTQFLSEHVYPRAVVSVKSLKIPKGVIRICKSKNRHTLANRKRTKGQTTIYKAYP